MTIYKTDFIAAVADRSNFSKKEISTVLNAIIDTIIDAIKAGHTVNFSNFGSFRVSERSAVKTTCNLTGELMSIPAKKSIHFRVSRVLKNRLNDC